VEEGAWDTKWRPVPRGPGRTSHDESWQARQQRGVGATTSPRRPVADQRVGHRRHGRQQTCHRLRRDCRGDPREGRADPCACRRRPTCEGPQTVAQGLRPAVDRDFARSVRPQADDEDPLCRSSPDAHPHQLHRTPDPRQGPSLACRRLDRRAATQRSGGIEHPLGVHDPARSPGHGRTRWCPGHESGRSRPTAQGNEQRGQAPDPRPR
jgi:hypothetical protein